MKKLYLMIVMMVVVACQAFAQDAETMNRVREQYKNMQTMEADVHMVKHNTMVTTDVTGQGKFYYRKPNSMCLNIANGQEVLLMNQGTLTMKRDGKVQSMKAGSNPQLDALKEIFQNFAAGSDDEVDLSEIADVDMDTKGNLVTLTIVPIVSDPKQKRRQMFTSFVVVVDKKASELKSVRLNEKGQNYTEYQFSKFKINGTIADSVFKVN